MNLVCGVRTLKHVPLRAAIARNLIAQPLRRPPGPFRDSGWRALKMFIVEHLKKVVSAITRPMDSPDELGAKVRDA